MGSSTCLSDLNPNIQSPVQNQYAPWDNFTKNRDVEVALEKCVRDESAVVQNQSRQRNNGLRFQINLKHSKLTEGRQ